MSEIKTVIFDFGGVLVNLHPQRSFDAFKHLGVADIETMLNPYRQKGFFFDLEMGHIDKVAFTEALSQHTGKKLEVSQIEEAIRLFLDPTPLYKLEYLESLRKHKQLFILSNTNEFVMDYVHSDAFLPGDKTLIDYVDKVYASCEVHALKPDAEIYEILLNDSGIQASEALFIDDCIDNIEAANTLGFQTMLAFNGVDWREDLNKRLGLQL